MSEPKFQVGDRVQKVRGYRDVSEEVTVFVNVAGEVRYVVECTAVGASGCLRIYSERDLELREGGES